MRTLLLPLSLLLFACSSPKPHPIEGTWTLVSMQVQQGMEMSPPVFTVIKIYTREHLFHINYIADGGIFGMALGGPFTARQDSFVETIGYYSEDPGFVGTKIPYALEFGENFFHQSGVIKSDDENIEDWPIEERYERLEPALSAVTNTHPLVGVWKLEKAAYNQMNLAQPLPDGEETLKVITPRYFYTVQSNPSNGEFEGVVFGTHRMDGEQYVENILSTSRDSLLAGWRLTFDYSVSENTFSQTTVVNQESYPNFIIEEHYRRVE